MNNRYKNQVITQDWQIHMKIHAAASLKEKTKKLALMTGNFWVAFILGKYSRAFPLSYATDNSAVNNAEKC